MEIPKACSHLKFTIFIDTSTTSTYATRKTLLFSCFVIFRS